MLIRQAPDILPSEITPQEVYVSRRGVMAAAAGAIAGAMLPGARAALADTSMQSFAKTPYGATEDKTSLDSVTHYNNYYEFGLDKTSPAEVAPGRLRTRPWTVKIEGECDKPGTVDIDDFLRVNALEERIYRHRCVEGWSMVIPWVGVPLGPVLQRYAPNANAKFVAFQTLNDPAQMPGLSAREFDWPYNEGLRIDEAMNPLAFLAVGVYGANLLAQNGAPIRLVVPWKYGFKSIKSIVSIRFVSSQPKTLWNTYAAREYGFYSNVNPSVDHPRWSQATERPIGKFFRKPTLMFNGYGEQVASLYGGMDLVKDF